MFPLNVEDDNVSLMTFKLKCHQAYLTKPTLVITNVHMLHFTRQDKDILERKLAILMSFCYEFIRHTNNYSNIAIFDKILAKLKWCNFLPHIVYVMT